VNHDLLAVDVDSDLPHVLGSAPRCVANSGDARYKRLQSDLPLAGGMDMLGIVVGVDMLGIAVGVEAPPNMGGAVAKLGVDMLDVIVGVEAPPNVGSTGDGVTKVGDATPNMAPKDFGAVAVDSNVNLGSADQWLTTT